LSGYFLLMQSNKPISAEEIKRIGNIPMNFVVGKERSGTTLLQVMLNTHSTITAPPESRFLMLLHSRYGKVKTWTEPLITNFCNDLYREKLFENFWKVKKDVLRSYCLAAKDFLTYPLICKIVFYLENPEKQVTLFFDKNPIYYYFLLELNDIFPEAKYIHIVRDYRANIVSHRHVFTIKQSADISFRWMKVNQLIEKAKSLYPKRFFTLKYESLVGDTATSLKEVCQFLGVPFDEKMAAEHTSGIYSSFNSNVKEGFRKIHGNVFKPVTSSYVDEWRKTLTPEDISTAESVAGEYAEKIYGYKMTMPEKAAAIGSSVTTKMKLKYFLIRKIYRAALNNPWLYFKIRTYLWRSF
jgi:hypothetical protein